MKKLTAFTFFPVLEALAVIISLIACHKDDDGPSITPSPPIDYTVLPPITQ